MDLYGVLGVTPNASQDDIKRAGKQRRRETHPDVGGDPEAFIAVGCALAILSDPEARRRYDQTGDAEPRSAENEIQANAMSYLNGMVINLVESGAVDSPFGDVIGTMRLDAMNTRSMVLQKIDELNVRVRKIERNKDKFRRLKGENFLKLALEHRLSELRKVVIRVERERDVYDKAVDLLASYRFDRDDPMPWDQSANPQSQSATAASPVDDFVARLARVQR
jgi:DnaJ-class molecular chaperone